MEEFLGYNADVRLIFSHPGVQFHFPNAGDNEAPANSLVIFTGANSIKWSYRLNTHKEPTYAGEVVQILSTNVGSITISGNSRSNKHLMSIYRWFREYMQVAGLNEHSQQPVKFQYPERGWELGLYITGLPSVRLARDVIAGEYRIQAEINQDDIPQIAEAIMSKYNSAMPSTLANMSRNVIVPKGIGYKRLNQYSEYLPPNTNITASQLNSWITNSTKNTANNIGNNFQTLIASWATGDFLGFAFDVTTGATGTEVQSPDDIWTKVFGSAFVDGSSPSTDTTGGAAAGGILPYPGDGGSQEDIANWMGSVFRAQGLPPELVVMIALTENGGRLYNNPGGDADSVGYFQIRPSTNYQPDTTTKQPAQWWIDHPDQQLKRTLEHAIDQKKNYFPPYTAVNLGQWSQAVQGSNFPDRYQTYYTQAKNLVKNLDAILANNGSTPPTGVRAAITAIANWGIAHEPQIGYGQGNGSFPKPRNDWIGTPPKTLPLSTDCSGFVNLSYKWAGAPCPSQGGNWAGNTDSLLAAIGEGRTKQILAASELKPGDIVVWGPLGSSHHTAIVVQSGDNPILASHGQESGPIRIDLISETAAQGGRQTTFINGLKD